VNLPKLLSFESGRIVFFETLTKHPENWQQNPTPLCIVRKMLDKPSLEEKKILVLFNIEFLQVLVEERKINPENIYYIADNELEYLSAIKIFKVQSYKLSDFSVPALKKLIAGIDMKFDVVFSNPPYNSNIDIKILNEIIDIADEFVVVHPSTWVLDVKGKTKLFTNFVNKIDGKVNSLEFFNGNPVFNIGLFVPCMITHIDNKFSGNASISYFDDDFEVDSISKVTKFGSMWKTLIQPFILTLKQYIEKNGEIWNKRIDAGNRQVNDNKFYCQLAGIIGNHSKSPNSLLKDDFYTLVMKDSERNKGVRNFNVRKDGFIVFEFITETEQNNFIKYLKTDFARFCLALTKNTQNNHYGEMELVPWLDFTEEWDDDKLFAKFDVSQELQDYIREFLPDYYGIRK
jgi:hypothetical protein